MSARSRTTFKVVLLSALYLSQGLPYGFFIQALPVFLRSEGVTDFVQYRCDPDHEPPPLTITDMPKTGKL